MSTILQPHSHHHQPPAEDGLTTLSSARRSILRSLFEPLDIINENAGMPTFDLYEQDGEYVLECAVPGYRREDIDIKVLGDTLVISGSYARNGKNKDVHYHVKESRRGDFSRSVTLPQDVDPARVKASLEDGVLNVKFRTMAMANSTTIQIE